MSKPIKTQMLRGARWWIESDACLPSGQFGECVWGIPGIALPTLRIPTDGDGKHDLDTIIHEALHACYPDMGERAVDETGTSIAGLLWRLGWRKDLDL